MDAKMAIKEPIRDSIEYCENENAYSISVRLGDDVYYLGDWGIETLNSEVCNLGYLNGR